MLQAQAQAQRAQAQAQAQQRAAAMRASLGFGSPDVAGLTRGVTQIPTPANITKQQYAPPPSLQKPKSDSSKQSSKRISASNARQAAEANRKAQEKKQSAARAQEAKFHIAKAPKVDPKTPPKKSVDPKSDKKKKSGISLAEKARQQMLNRKKNEAAEKKRKAQMDKASKITGQDVYAGYLRRGK